MNRIFVAAMICLTLSAAARAQDIPAAKGLDASAQAALRQLIDDAVKEGALNYADTIIQPTTNNDLVAAFKTYYGLPDSFRVNFTLLGSAAMVTRLEQEMSAGKLSFDVAAVASPIWAFEANRQGRFLEYHSPQYAAYRVAFAAGLGVDGFFIFNGGYSQIPIWNSEIFDFHGKTYKDVADAVEPSRFSIGDAKQSESQLTTYVGLRQIFDVAFFKTLAEKKPTFIYRSELSAQRVLTGQDMMAMGGGAARVMTANQKGARLKLLYPTDGFTLLPQSTFILKGAAHPNAAKLWIDFILSEQGQRLVTSKEALISGRTGFTSPIPDIAPDLGSVKAIKVDWQGMNSDTLKKYRDEWESIFNP
jgi:iron(III) transport system substrate-binding protein